MVAEVIYAANEYTVISSMIGIFGFIFLIGILLSFFKQRRSYDYRKTLTDLYIAAKIRAFSKEEDLDLNEEWRNFAKYSRNKKTDFEDLDKTIERSVQEKINNKVDEVIEKEKEKKIEKAK